MDKVERRNKKIKVTFVTLSAFLIYIAYGSIWYFGAYKTYQKYQDGFSEIANSGAKLFVDAEGYNYSVKFPPYLRWVGNLTIAEANIDHALIIWPGVLGCDSSTGVILTHESVQYQIELKNKTTSIDPEYQELINKNLEVIALLYDKANDIWNLELE